jgi:hypothetical protein
MTETEAKRLEQELSTRFPSASSHVHLDGKGNFLYISCWEKEIVVTKIKPIEQRLIPGS